MYSQKYNCYFQNRIIMFSLPVPTLILLWEIYIFPGLVCLFCCREVCGRILGIYKPSQTHECGHWDWGRAVPRKGIHKWDFLAVHPPTASPPAPPQRLTLPLYYKHIPDDTNLRSVKQWKNKEIKSEPVSYGYFNIKLYDPYMCAILHWNINYCTVWK